MSLQIIHISNKIAVGIARVGMVFVGVLNEQGNIFNGYILQWTAFTISQNAWTKIKTMAPSKIDVY